MGLREAFKAWNDEICWTFYFKYLAGGALPVRLLGILVGILNNVTFAVTKKLAYYIKFRSSELRDRFIFVITTFFSYVNSALYATASHTRMPYLSVTWFTTFSTTILSALVMTNLTPYLGVLFDLIVNKCVRKRKRSELYFEFERKNAQVLSSIFVVFTYGFGLPVIFGYLLIPFIIFSLFDRWLIVYWCKP